jgi:hypothetical protein
LGLEGEEEGGRDDGGEGDGELGGGTDGGVEIEGRNGIGEGLAVRVVFKSAV